jgi:hypothetical protein
MLELLSDLFGQIYCGYREDGCQDTSVGGIISPSIKDLRVSGDFWKRPASYPRLWLDGGVDYFRSRAF